MKLKLPGVEDLGHLVPLLQFGPFLLGWASGDGGAMEDLLEVRVLSLEEEDAGQQLPERELRPEDGGEVGDAGAGLP